MKIKNFGLKDMGIMPISDPDACPVCGVKHDPNLPHDRDSLYYQYSFRKKHGRWPTWEDAMDHCSEDMKIAWIAAMGAYLKNGK